MSGSKTAHDISQKARTDDIRPSESVDFAGLLLSEHVLQGLTQAGFERPSPIQLKAIPLGRCGLDLIVQAKSGTGKTCVFSVIALEGVFVNASSTQALILAPTREIAVQIWEVINSIGSMMPQLRCYTFIGGMPLAEDKQKLKKCHIAVGTPGRIKQLIEMEEFNTESVRLFVLDEADKMMEEGMQETVNWIYSCLPENKQMLAVSATYPEVLAQHLTAYMRNPTFIRLNTSDPTLLGIRQYYKMTAFHPLPQKAFEKKVDCLLQLLSSVTFHQCLVFSNYQMRAQSLSESLCEKGWPATYISGSQAQEHRLTAMAKLKKFKCRVLVSTDLTSRGIDAEHVNLVVNLDLPWDHETYLHRIGRAGRFGSYGASVTLVSAGTESSKLKQIEKKCNTRILELPDPVPNDLCRSSGYVNLDKLVSAEKLVTQTSCDASDNNNTDNGDAAAESDDVTASAGDAYNESLHVAAKTNGDAVNSNDADVSVGTDDAAVKTNDVSSEVTVKSDDAIVKAADVSETTSTSGGKVISNETQIETCDKETRPDERNIIMNGHCEDVAPANSSQNTASKSQTKTSTNQSVTVAPSTDPETAQNRDERTQESSPAETDEKGPDKYPTVNRTLTEAAPKHRLTDIQQLLMGPNISTLSSQSLKSDKRGLKPWSALKIVEDFQAFMSSKEDAEGAEASAAAETILPDSDSPLKQPPTSREEDDLTLGLEYMEKLRARDVSKSEGYTTDSDYSSSESDYSSVADEKTHERKSHLNKPQNYDRNYFHFDGWGGGDAQFHTNYQDNHQAWYGSTNYQQEDPRMSEYNRANQKPSYNDWTNQHPSYMQTDPHSLRQANQHASVMGLPSNPHYDWLSAHYQYSHWLAANHQLYLSNQSYQHYVYHAQCVNYCSRVQQQNLRFQQIYQQQKAYIRHMSKQ